MIDKNIFHEYSNKEGSGWYGWFEDDDGRATAYVDLDLKIRFAHEFGL